MSRVVSLSVEQIEYYSEGINIPTNISDVAEMRKLIAAILREQCWFKLTGKDFFIHFGYDYYMYIGTALSAEIVEKTANQYGLFCEQYPSPYNAAEE